jgi:hypothetical protein
MPRSAEKNLKGESGLAPTTAIIGVETMPAGCRNERILVE